MNLKHIFIIILFSIGLKVAYLSCSLVVEGNEHSLKETYIGAVKNNDSFWYQYIAIEGYSKITNKRDLGYSEGPYFKQSEWAFFPFYPKLIELTIQLTGLDFNNSALIWSFLFSTSSMLLLYWFGTVFFKNADLGLFSTLLLFSFPFSYYFSMFYTEAIFLTFALSSFLCIHYKKHLFLAFFLIPLTLVRANGLFVLFPLYLYFLEQNGIMQKFKIEWKRLFSSQNLIQSLAFSSAPLVFILYGLYQYQMTGYFFAFSIAQDGWYREAMFPILSFFRSGDVSTQFNSVYSIIVIVYAFWIRKKLPISLNMFVLVSLLLPLCSGSVTSMTRFISVIFPMFFILALSIQHLKSKYLILIGVLLLHFLSYYSWLIDHPIAF